MVKNLVGLEKKASHFPEIEAQLQDSEGPKAIDVFLFMSEPHQAHPATAVCAALHEVVVPAEKKTRQWRNKKLIKKNAN